MKQAIWTRESAIHYGATLIDKYLKYLYPTNMMYVVDVPKILSEQVHHLCQ
eukprot:m.169716 g.169716  ORF g.169716 m.169716 type:complete len:51 (+) comp15327_c0_seq35:4667-4819(+)